MATKSTWQTVSDKIAEARLLLLIHQLAVFGAICVTVVFYPNFWVIMGALSWTGLLWLFVDTAFTDAETLAKIKESHESDN